MMTKENLRPLPDSHSLIKQWLILWIFVLLFTNSASATETQRLPDFIWETLGNSSVTSTTDGKRLYFSSYSDKVQAKPVTPLCLDGY